LSAAADGNAVFNALFKVASALGEVAVSDVNVVIIASVARLVVFSKLATRGTEVLAASSVALRLPAAAWVVRELCMLMAALSILALVQAVCAFCRLVVACVVLILLPAGIALIAAVKALMSVSAWEVELPAGGVLAAVKAVLKFARAAADGNTVARLVLKVFNAC